jgi:hypothetical protein
VALRREQRKEIEINQTENKVMGKEGETDQRGHMHSPRERRNGCKPVGVERLFFLIFRITHGVLNLYLILII